MNTAKQEEFIQLLLAGKNIYLSGKAGTGESHITKEGIAKLEKLGKKIIAVAPTGVAANNIGGQTIHSMFGITPYGVCTYESASMLKSEKRKLLKKVEVILIDEVSMLRPDLLDAIHWSLIKNGIKGGLREKQVVFIGDLKQLPPIVSDNERSILYQQYDGEGQKSEYFRQFLHSEPNGIILAPYNETVRQYNQKGLAAQPGKELVFEASVSGNAKADEFNVESVIRVKHGCKIIYLANSRNNPLRNGTLGTFINGGNDKYFIRVGEVNYALDVMEFTKMEYVWNQQEDKLEMKEIGKIIQYPFKLAYALSIHKSQGLTFEEVTIDLTRPCFMPGQMYVAISRVKSPAGLRILANR